MKARRDKFCVPRTQPPNSNPELRADFLKKATSYNLFFNLARKNSGKENKTPWELVLEKRPKASPLLPLLAPVFLDELLVNQLHNNPQRGYDVWALPSFLGIPESPQTSYPPWRGLRRAGAVLLAHLIRDVKFLVHLPDQVTANYGRRLLEELRQLFHVIHRRKMMPAARFQRALEQARDRVLKIGKRAPPRTEAQNLADRFRRHGAACFRFITTPGLEPTNNLAEQAIRFVVKDRHVTQGTRSPRGRRWCERIWTATATCAQQNRSVFEFAPLPKVRSKSPENRVIRPIIPRYPKLAWRPERWERWRR